jgi:hypothetical protein
MLAEMTQFSFFNIESNLWCFIDDFLQCEFLEIFYLLRHLLIEHLKRNSFSVLFSSLTLFFENFEELANFRFH